VREHKIERCGEERTAVTTENEGEAQIREIKKPFGGEK